MTLTLLPLPLPMAAATDGRHVRDASEARALFAGLTEGPLEQCGIAYLDPEWRLLGLRYSPLGRADGVAVPLRDIVRDVLALDAAAVVLAHNHPRGDPAPSEADLAVTRRLLHALDALDVRLVDHVVLAGVRWSSMRALGLL